MAFLLFIYLFIIRNKILNENEEESARSERNVGKDMRVRSNEKLCESRESK